MNSPPPLMPALDQKALWNSALAEALLPADANKVWRYVFDALREGMGLSSLAVIQYVGDAMPKVPVNFSADDPVGRRISAYLKGAYLLDPFFRANLEKPIEGCYTIEDLSERDFGKSEYYDTFFSVHGLSDEINLFIQSDGGACFAISLGREKGAPKFNDADRSALSDCKPFLHALVAQFRNSAKQSLNEADQVLRSSFHQGIKSAIERLGTSVLTHREKTIFDYLIRGYSVKATANRLHIMDGTVRMHRYNIYRKFDVRSQTEVFALVIEALKHFDLTARDDPLARLL